MDLTSGSNFSLCDRYRDEVSSLGAENVTVNCQRGLQDRNTSSSMWSNGSVITEREIQKTLEEKHVA
jgi:hypothetical protein